MVRSVGAGDGEAVERGKFASTRCEGCLLLGERQGGGDEEDQDDRVLELGQQEGQGVRPPTDRTTQT